MDIQNFERAAYLREPMPDGLCLAEQKAFLALRFLYSEFDRGVISKLQATLEKRKVMNQMNHELAVDRMNEKTAQLWRRIEIAGMTFTHNPTIENANKFYAAVYGLPENWQKQQSQGSEIK